jgi:hypothetical protein
MYVVSVRKHGAFHKYSGLFSMSHSVRSLWDNRDGTVKLSHYNFLGDPLHHSLGYFFCIILGFLILGISCVLMHAHTLYLMLRFCFAHTPFIIYSITFT